MPAVQFVLALHNHQPVGNFENVFQEAFKKCYEPFLKFLEEHPSFRLSLHYSGCLFDWLEARERQFLKRLARLVQKGRVELLGGGYYEPILPLIPERDAIAQMRYMNQYLLHRFGRQPSGFWLTERVWEPKLPRLAAQAGLRYTAVDDTHFSLAGFSEGEIVNFFLTEEEGRTLYVFPSSRLLRYRIPFRDPGETVDVLRKAAEQNPDSPTVTYADDAEKFGLWPGTYQWVYREGWLEKFAEALEQNRDWIHLKTFSEVLEERKGLPVRKAYLPTASYDEMEEWALGIRKSRQWGELKRDLESLHLWERVRRFVRGGTFKNFLSKYPEADWMRSKMVWVSQKVERMKAPARKRRAEKELWQAQCNCPYWHGIFGGLYLHHLRRSTYQHLIRAERLCGLRVYKKPFQLTEEDLNHDGAREVVLECPPFTFYLLPERGGSLAELDFQPAEMNVLDVVTRREEAYHQQALGVKADEESRGRSIHEIAKAIPTDLMQRVGFDSCERFSFLDHFLLPETTFKEFWSGKFHPLVQDPTRIRYSQNWHRGKRKGMVVKLKGEILLTPGGGKLSVEKGIQTQPGENGFFVTWILRNESSETLKCLWGNEWSFNFYEREKEAKKVRQLQIQDGWSRVCLEVTCEDPFDAWLYPIETLAQTEKDFRLLHQGVSFFPHWGLALAPGEVFSRRLHFLFSHRE